MQRFLAPTLAAILMAAVSAEAQDEKRLTTLEDRDQSVRVTVSGAVVLDYVWRSRELTAFTNTAVPYAAPLNPSRSETTFEGYAAVRFDVELSDQVSAVVEVGTRRVDGGAITRWGTAGAPPVELREAAVVVYDFLEFVMPDIRAQFGISDWNFDLRGRGDALAFDPRHSPPLGRNLRQLGPNPAQAETGDARLALARTPNELEPVGATFSYVRSSLSTDLVLLPAAIEAGPPSADESLFAYDAWYRFDEKGSKFGVITAILHDPGATIFTWGGGLDLHDIGTSGLEIYLEGYDQRGRAGETPAGQGVKARGAALRLGGEYHLPDDPDQWLGGEFRWLSGEGSRSPGSHHDGRFISYESARDLMILEDQYLGFDWDSNLRLLKAMAGRSISMGGKSPLDLKLIAGVARADHEVGFTGSTDRSRQLGTEIDFTARWHFNKQASLGAGVGALFGSTILRESMEATGYTSRQAENHAWLATMGVDVKF